jgi:hypothetical protein
MFLLQPGMSIRRGPLLDLELPAARDLFVDRLVKLNFRPSQRGTLGAELCAFRAGCGKRMFSLDESASRRLNFCCGARQILLKVDSLVEKLALDLGKVIARNSRPVKLFLELVGTLTDRRPLSAKLSQISATGIESEHE